MAAPEHLLCVNGVAETLGTGFTTTVAVTGVPLQVPSDGVMVNVTVTGVVPLFTSVPLILPVPDVGMVPVIPALSLVQLKIAPGVVLVITIGVMDAPLHNCCVDGLAEAAAVGFTITVDVTVLLLQP